MKQKFIKIFFSPLFASLIPTIVIIYLLPYTFNKYHVTLERKNAISSYVSYRYCDLNNDDFSEKIELEISFDDMVQLRVLEDYKIIEQWNFTGRMVGSMNPVYGDINGDKIKEILLFTYHSGEIYLNVINPITIDTLVSERSISKYDPISNKTDCGIHFCGFYDMNRDGNNEIYFSTAASYSRSPRNMFRYDYNSDSLFVSESGCNIIEEPVAFDLNSDGYLEFIGRSAAVGNCSVNDLYSDHYSWLMVFDAKMNFVFEPKQIGFYPSRLQVKPFVFLNKNYLIALNHYTGDKGYDSYLMLIDEYGNKIKERIFILPNENNGIYLFQHPGDFKNTYMITNSGEISRIDGNLNMTHVSKLPISYNYKTYSIDVDNDSKNEVFLFPKGLGTAIITRNNFSKPVNLDLDENDDIKSYSIVKRGKEPPLFYLETENTGYYFLYKKNPNYYLKYIFYPGIYLFFVVIMFGLQQVQKHRIEQKFEAEKEMASLQLKAIKNQVEPHFTLNIINSIGSLIYKNDKDKADYVFGKYSKLLRSTLLNSERVVTTLAEEIEYVKNYLELERFRMNEKFDFIIDFDEELDQTVKIPRMLIHTFVENSIKHGIKHLDSDGMIEIIGNKNEIKTSIKIIDNGIGIEKAKELNEYSTGKGLRIIDQIIELYYKLEGEKIAYEIIDKNGQGTEIIVTVSYE